MKTYLLSSLILIIGAFSFASQAYVPSSANTDLATSVISTESNVAQEVIKLYKSHLNNPNSKISKHLEEFRSDLIEADASDLILMESRNSAGVLSISYLLPIRTEKKSSISTLTYIVVSYINDTKEEEIGLSTKIYLSRFTNLIIKN